MYLFADVPVKNWFIFYFNAFKIPIVKQCYPIPPLSHRYITPNYKLETLLSNFYYIVFYLIPFPLCYQDLQWLSLLFLEQALTSHNKSL